MPTAAQVPRWLFDDRTVENEIYAVHTQTPRFVARMQLEDEFEELPALRLEIDGGWIAVPVEWFDRYDRTTFNREEMEESANAAWKRFDRDID